MSNYQSTLRSQPAHTAKPSGNMHSGIISPKFTEWRFLSGLTTWVAKTRTIADDRTRIRAYPRLRINACVLIKLVNLLVAGLLTPQACRGSLSIRLSATCTMDGLYLYLEARSDKAGRISRIPMLSKLLPIGRNSRSKSLAPVDRPERGDNRIVRLPWLSRIRHVSLCTSPPRRMTRFCKLVSPLVLEEKCRSQETWI